MANENVTLPVSTSTLPTGGATNLTAAQRLAICHPIDTTLRPTGGMNGLTPASQHPVSATPGGVVAYNTEVVHAALKPKPAFGTAAKP